MQFSIQYSVFPFTRSGCPAKGGDPRKCGRLFAAHPGRLASGPRFPGRGQGLAGLLLRVGLLNSHQHGACATILFFGSVAVLQSGLKFAGESMPSAGENAQQKKCVKKPAMKTKGSSPEVLIGSTASASDACPAHVAEAAGRDAVYMVEGKFVPGKRPRSKDDFLLRMWFVYGKQQKSHYMKVISGQMVRHKRGVSLPGPADPIVDSQETEEPTLGKAILSEDDLDSDQNLTSGSPFREPSPDSDAAADEVLQNSAKSIVAQ